MSNLFNRMVEQRAEVMPMANRPKPSDDLVQNRSSFLHLNSALSSHHRFTPASRRTRATYVRLSAWSTTLSISLLILRRPSSAPFERARVFTSPPSCQLLPLPPPQQRIVRGCLPPPHPNLPPAASCAPVSFFHCLYSSKQYFTDA